MNDRIEVDHEANLAAARREAEMWRTAKDGLAERLNHSEAEVDRLNEHLESIIAAAEQWKQTLDPKPTIDAIARAVLGTQP